MSKVFIFDIDKCNGCHNCQVACKDEHCGTSWLPYAAEQPDTGQFWMKVDEKVRGSVPKVKVTYIPHNCMHCSDAPCMDAAENEAVYRRADGMVIVDPEKAKGQKAIADACPYDAVYWNEQLSLPQKCTGCAHLLDDGWKEPRCVDACATGALRFGEASEFEAEIAQAEILKPEEGTSPQVYYLNLPKRFVAGEIYDPEEDEVIIGAKIVLTDDNSALEAESDEFGDFWFRQVDPGVYAVSIEAPGYLPRNVSVDATKEDINIGAVALYATAE